MDIFEVLGTIGYYAKRYFWPTIFLIVGLFLLKVAVVPVNEVLADGSTYPVKQSSGFLYASLFFLLASVVWFLYLLEIVKTVVGYAVMVVLGVCSLYLIYTDYTTIKSKVDLDAASIGNTLEKSINLGQLDSLSQMQKLLDWDKVTDKMLSLVN